MTRARESLCSSAVGGVVDVSRACSVAETRTVSFCPPLAQCDATEHATYLKAPGVVPHGR